MPRGKVSLWSCMTSTPPSQASVRESHSCHRFILYQRCPTDDIWLNSPCSECGVTCSIQSYFLRVLQSSDVQLTSCGGNKWPHTVAGQFILLIVLSEAAQEAPSVCITSHLLGHNVETEALHYLALHGCPPSCVCSALSPLAQEEG